MSRQYFRSMRFHSGHGSGHRVESLLVRWHQSTTGRCCIAEGMHINHIGLVGGAEAAIETVQQGGPTCTMDHTYDRSLVRRQLSLAYKVHGRMCEWAEVRAVCLVRWSGSVSPSAPAGSRTGRSVPLGFMKDATPAILRRDETRPEEGWTVHPRC